MDVSTVLPARPASVGAARRWLADTLASWDLLGVDYDISVVLSELVTNAVLHAGTDLTVRASYEDGAVHLEVEDSSPALPIARSRSPSATTGRGLLLVEALTSSWGCQRIGTGKVVWAEFNDVDSFLGGGEIARLRTGFSGGGRRAGDGATDGSRSDGGAVAGTALTTHPLEAGRAL